MRQGKVAGAKKGMWTNGSPPYPYVYNQTTKMIEVAPDKLKIYRMIVDKYFLGMSTLQIAIWLNQRKIAPPYSGKRNKHGWSHVSIHRLLISEIHLGYVIYGKSRSHRGTAQLVDKEDWIKVKGEHEPVKTEEEHAQIMARIEQNKIIPRKCRAGMLPLSGLLYCSKCGRQCNLSGVGRKAVTTGRHYAPIPILTGENVIRWVENWMMIFIRRYISILLRSTSRHWNW